MTTKRTGTPWMTPTEYGRSLTGLSVNLVVRDVARSLPFYRDVLGMTVHYADLDFAALQIAGASVQLHADGEDGKRGNCPGDLVGDHRAFERDEQQHS